MRLTNAIPRQSLTANTTRIKLYWAEDVTGKPVYYKTYTVPDLVGTNGGVVGLYREVKIHRLNVYYQSDSSASTKGSVVLVVADYDENSGFSGDVDKCKDFITYMMMPGAMVRRVYQNVSAAWFPTEPSDREWRDVASTTQVCDIFLMHSDAKAKSNLDGRVFVIADISVRGRNDKATVSIHQGVSGNRPPVADDDLPDALRDVVHVYTTAMDV